jgi:hypothetical protein
VFLAIGIGISIGIRRVTGSLGRGLACADVLGSGFYSMYQLIIEILAQLT